jgi:CO dehydrogenase/acetyl-CoA synthase delta subunit
MCVQEESKGQLWDEVTGVGLQLSGVDLLGQQKSQDRSHIVATHGAHTQSMLTQACCDGGN